MEKLYTGRNFDEFELDEIIISPARTVTDAHISAFSGISGDFNPLHTDDEFCKNTVHGGRIAHGTLTLSISAGLFNRYVDGTCIAFLEIGAKYLKAVRPGDTIHIKATVKSKKLSSKGGKGVIVFGIETINQNDEIVLEGDWTLLIKV
jgi:acyl dehydratase